MTHHDMPDDRDLEIPIMETMIPAPSGCWEDEDAGDTRLPDQNDLFPEQRPCD